MIEPKVWVYKTTPEHSKLRHQRLFRRKSQEYATKRWGGFGFAPNRKELYGFRCLFKIPS